MTSEGSHGGRPQSAGGPPPGALSGQGSARGVQFVKFSFYRVGDDLRRGSEADRLTIAASHHGP